MPTTPSASSIPADDPAALNAAIDARREMAEPDYRLEVLCTDKNGKRAMSVYPSGTVIWDNKTQVVLPSDARVALLDIIRERDFASMAPSYGGKAKGPQNAALKIRCRVALDVGAATKSSIQELDGEQSPLVDGLANALLDRVEPLVAEGMTATDLNDGLQKLNGGALRPEALQLRFVQLPADKKGMGVIYSIDGGMTSRQDYAPGRKVGDPAKAVVEEATLSSVTSALLAADLGSMPVNLRAGQHVEVDVRVLGHGRTVIARNFALRTGADDHAAQQQRFDALLAELRKLAGMQ